MRVTREARGRASALVLTAGAAVLVACRGAAVGGTEVAGTEVAGTEVAGRRQGVAEGLAIGEQQVFIVLDNNGQARDADVEDRRPLLFVFERPPEL